MSLERREHRQNVASGPSPSSAPPKTTAVLVLAPGQPLPPRAKGPRQGEAPSGPREDASDSLYLVEVFGSRPHFLPRLVQELDTDAEKLFEGSVVGEEHRVEVVAGLAGWRGEKGDEGGSLQRAVRTATCVRPRGAQAAVGGGGEGVSIKRPQGSPCATWRFKVRYSDPPSGTSFG